ncbi:MAG: branched-chain amino acid ABC transporter permease [Actinobacteria bacterium]|nr:branched-chain amino acid ABC transporter permease [Candidatus Planktophila sp.]PHX66640.1 MAG: branched-chain amino acid ABC transporter permease [Actinomycetota bacterium]
MMINIRDKGASIWESWSPPARSGFVLIVITLVALLPYAGSFGPTSFLDTPISSYQAVLVYPIALFVLMGLGLNIVVGKSGLLDLGYVAFFAIGAYTMGIMGTMTSLNTWEILPFGIFFAMLAGLLLGLPALRLRGDYLAIVTLGFGEIVRIIALNLSVTGGPNGIVGVPTPPPVLGQKFELEDHAGYFWVILILILLVIWMIRRFTIRRPGRAWEAIRQDEDVAALMGVNLLVYKLWSFTIGAAVGGAGGVIYASKTMFIAPDMFTFNTSILVLACIVFGGLGNIWGVILGASILAYLPERIRFISNARQLVFGLVLLVIMNVRPDGLLPRKKREKIKQKEAV